MIGKHILCCLTIVFMGFLSETTSTNLLRNPSFEQTPCTTPCNQDQAFMPSDWLSLNFSPDTYSNDGSYGLYPSGFGNFTGATAQDGIRWVAGWSLYEETFGQVLTAPLTPGQEYTLSAYLRESVRWDLAHPGTYQIELWNSTDISSADKIIIGSFQPLIANQNAWELRRLIFIAPPEAATHTVLAFRPVGSDAGPAYPGIDNLVLSASSFTSQCAPPPPNMVSWWSGEGNASDIIGSNNGALQGGATFAPGKVGQGFSFNGVDAYVSIPDSPSVSITGQISIDTWIKPNSVSGPTAQAIVSKYNTACPFFGVEQRSYWFGVLPGGSIRFCVYSGGPDQYHCIDTIDPIAANVFTHVAATFNPATQGIKIYINGLEAPASLVPGSVTVDSIFDSDTPVEIGRVFCATDHNYFSGLIDEVELFNRELTANEIDSIFKAGSAGKCLPSSNTPPVAACQDVTVSAGADCVANASIDNGSFDPDGDAITITQSPAGPYLLGNTLVTLTVTDGKGGSSQCTATVTVTNNPPTASAGGPYSVNEGGSIIVTASGSDPEGGALSYAWDLDNNGTFETPGQSVTFSAAGLDGPTSRTIKVRVTDTCGLSKVAATTVNVLNVAPTVGAITAPLDPTQVNTIINTSAGFTDPGIPDTHTAVWDWGDVATSAGVVTETNGSGTVSGNHSYTTPGVYTLKLTVTDDDSGANQSTFQYVVIYDPSGGFVTGGGWINSPAGAYTPDPTLTGKAHFGFTSKYQSGATAPSGDTSFRFQEGNLNFQSTSYEWLVIAGARAQFKGEGTINGSGRYGFLLTAIDGQISGGGGVDKFRIKIWDKNNGDAIVYDNQMGADDSGNPTTALGGGNIVIHK
jgi:hypothetical protein